MSPEYLLTTLVVCLMPGIGVIYTLSATLGGGLRAGLWAVVGCTLATVVHLVLALAGLAAVLHTSSLLFQTVKWAGVAYLLWMAWGTLRDRDALRVEGTPSEAPLRLVWRGIALSLLNPKVPLFFVAFLPQFVPADSPDPTALLIQLGGGFVAMTFAVFLIYTFLAGAMRTRVLSSARAMDGMRRAFAASFAALGVKLAVERS